MDGNSGERMPDRGCAPDKFFVFVWVLIVLVLLYFGSHIIAQAIRGH